MSLSPLTFSGLSDFSADFSKISDRAVQIAQIPVKQLQNKDTDALQQKSLLGGVASATSALAASLKALGSTAANSALTASSSNSTKVSVVNAGATSATSYTINSITSIATAASERSASGYAPTDAVSANGSMRLVVGGQQYNFTLTTNTLAGLKDKINSLGAGVTASVLTTESGNYLSVAASTTGETTLQLIDDPSGAAGNLLTSANQGTNAVFSLNGIPIEQQGNVVNSVIPGLIFTLHDAYASPITLSLATDRTELSSKLQDFVSGYNALRQEVNAQMGPQAGLLTGHLVISQLANKLRQIAGYQRGTGAIKNLADLGIEFSSTGEASLNSTVFNALSDSGITSAFTFVGSATSGLGGFSAGLDEISNPTTGLIRAEQDGLDRIDKRLQTQMGVLNERIALMQSGLALKLQKADALLATLASQQRTLTASLQGLTLALYGKNQG